MVLLDDGEKNTADFLNDYLQRYYGFKLATANKATNNFITLRTSRFIQKPDKEERYTLAVTPQSITIAGNSYQGTFYGMQTLLQLLPVEPQTKLNNTRY